jgi:dTDP-6-deoxy-L-talose 4-dehydrogenase (NAD+)
MERPDVLIHLAWSGLPNYKSLHHFEQELPAQYRFLKGLIESGLQTLVVAGTCFEYGMQSGSLSEDIAPRPNNPYGSAKDALRCDLEYLKAAHPFQLTWARFFYLYGEGQPESSLLPQLRQAAERGDRIFNMSGGEQLRDYLPVAEAARYLVSLALAKKDIGIVNVCAGAPVSVRKLVEGWIQENGWLITPNLGHYPYPDYEPMAFWGDPEKLYSLIGKTT